MTKFEMFMVLLGIIAVLTLIWMDDNNDDDNLRPS